MPTKISINMSFQKSHIDLFVPVFSFTCFIFFQLHSHDNKKSLAPHNKLKKRP